MLESRTLRRLLVPLAALAFHAGNAGAAVITSYTNLATWTAAAGASIATEDFADSTLISGLSVTGGGIGGGVFSGQALPQVFPASSRDGFLFAPATKAFGANWDLAPGGPGAGIGFTFIFDDATTQDFFGISNPPTGGTFNGFFGFVSDTAIASVTFYTGQLTGNSELFNVDDLRLATQGGNVPEPGSLALLLAAGLGLLVPSLARRRQS